MVYPAHAQEPGRGSGPASAGLGNLFEVHACNRRDRAGPGWPGQREGHALTSGGARHARGNIAVLERI